MMDSYSKLANAIPIAKTTIKKLQILSSNIKWPTSGYRLQYLRIMDPTLFQIVSRVMYGTRSQNGNNDGIPLVGQ